MTDNEGGSDLGTASSHAGFPIILSAKQVVERGIVPITEQNLIVLAKKHQIGRKMGRMIVFRPSDIEELLERLPGPCNYEVSERARPGMSEFAIEKAFKLIAKQKAERKTRKPQRG